MRRASRGFSLIELLIVVAIILIISAIAIPSLLRSRIAANQASAIESMRIIATAEVSYFTTYGSGFSTSLTALGPPPSGQPASPTAAGLIDETLAGGNKSGYTFTYTQTDLDPSTGKAYGYTLQGNPAVYGQTGGMYYFSDQSHVIRGNAASPATSTDSAVGD